MKLCCFLLTLNIVSSSFSSGTYTLEGRNGLSIGFDGKSRSFRMVDQYSNFVWMLIREMNGFQLCRVELDTSGDELQVLGDIDLRVNHKECLGRRNGRLVLRNQPEALIFTTQQGNNCVSLSATSTKYHKPFYLRVTANGQIRFNKKIKSCFWQLKPEIVAEVYDF